MDLEEGNPNEFSDEDVEEAELSDKVNKLQRRNQENYSSEDEVMGFDSDESENENENDMKSDIHDYDENFELPNEKAWGKNKKAFYSTDYVDADYDAVNQKDIAKAEIEEQEAKNLQKRLAEQFDDADFGLDFVVTKDDTSELPDSNDLIKTDLTKLSSKQKQKLFEQESPEFLPLIQDLKDQLEEGKIFLTPCLELFKKLDCKNSMMELIKIKYDLSLHYCVNIMYYMNLKASKEPVSSHPVIKRLAQYRELMTQLEKNQGDVLKKIKKSFEDCKTLDLSTIKKLSKYQTKKNEKNFATKKSVQENGTVAPDTNKFAEENSDFDEHMEDSNENVFEEENNAEMEKRAITYQIAKNKGLTPFRKKEQRNPRVKHRNAYRKATIRRKGAVRSVRKENTRYGGEISGVKSSVTKSIKFK